MSGRVTLTAVAVVALVLAGCQPSKKPTEVAGVPTKSPTAAPSAIPSEMPPPPPGAGPIPGATAPGATQPKSDKPVTEKPATPGDLRDFAAKAAAHPMPEKAMTIDTKDASGWKAASLPSLGKEADEALTRKRDLAGVASVFYEVEGNKLTAKAKVKLRDHKTYSIEYFLPETGPSKNEYRADGQRAFRVYDRAWSPVSEAQADRRLSEWLRKFAANQFNAVTLGAHGWDEVVSRLKSGEDGFKAETQSKTMTLQGKTHRLSRILATRDDKTEFEAVFDADQHLPVTVRFNSPGKNGAADKMMWTCQWAEGGKHEPKDFTLPATIPTSPKQA